VPRDGPGWMDGADWPCSRPHKVRSQCLSDAAHLSYHWFLVNAALCALISKTKTNQSQGRGVTPLNVLYSCLMSK
jgi:hypothetical protein